MGVEVEVEFKSIMMRAYIMTWTYCPYQFFLFHRRACYMLCTSALLIVRNLLITLFD